MSLTFCLLYVVCYCTDTVPGWTLAGEANAASSPPLLAYPTPTPNPHYHPRPGGGQFYPLTLIIKNIKVIKDLAIKFGCRV